MSIRPKCNPAIWGILLLGLLSSLSGCFPEGTKGCPEDLFLSFYLDDQYDKDRDYDSRVANDVYLYVFQDQQLAGSFQIGYDDIKGGKEYVIAEKAGMAGNLDYIAWAVSKDAPEDDYIPAWSQGEDLNEITMELRPSTRLPGYYEPVSVEHYMGRVTSFDKIDEVTRHKIGVGVSTCRVEVNVTDFSASVLGAAQSVFVGVNGTMNRMTMQQAGAGDEAVVIAEMTCEDGAGYDWSTGRFGVLPSSEGQTVSVDIFTDGTLVQTLEVPADQLPKGAEAGELLIFDYTLGEGHFYLTIDDYDVMIVIVDEI